MTHKRRSFFRVIGGRRLSDIVGLEVSCVSTYVQMELLSYRMSTASVWICRHVTRRVAAIVGSVQYRFELDDVRHSVPVGARAYS